jgi:hypothetical protein
MDEHVQAAEYLDCHPDRGLASARRRQVHAGGLRRAPLRTQCGRGLLDAREIDVG